MKNFLNLRTLLVIFAFAICASAAEAQVSVCSNGCNNPNGIKVGEPWGYYLWQIDQGSLTTTLKTESGYNNAPSGNGFSTGLFSLPAGRNIHEIHGTVNLTVHSNGSCGTGAIIAEVQDQAGNTLASVWLQNEANNTVTSIPIRGTFPSAPLVSQLSLNTYNNQCSALTLSWDLVMD
jgi:hypothetical protein